MKQQPMVPGKPLSRFLCAIFILLMFLPSVPRAHAGGLGILRCTVEQVDQTAQSEDPVGGEGSGLINLLLIGQDSRSSDNLSRSDCIILCSFRPKTKEITVTSFLRDLYVEIPRQQGNRINAAFASGGMPLLKQTLTENFNVCIDGCIAVDFSHFSKIIDILGGVTLDLRQDEADVINQAVPGTLSEGTMQLTGEQALVYSRIRKLDADGDFSRTERQRKLITSLLNSYREASLLTILSVITDTLPMLSTDLEKRQIFLLAAKLFPLLEDPIVVSHRIPADGTYSNATIRGMDVLTTDLEEARNRLRELLLSSDESGS